MPSGTKGHKPCVADVDRQGLAIPGVEGLVLIGRGGFASVYGGWQPRFRREVAVKVLDATTADPSTAARFQREVMAMGALSHHPHVVPIYDAGTVDDRPYLIMPKLPSGSLDDELRNGPFDAAATVEIGLAMADALAAAHRTGLLHRDVKPGNILHDEYGNPLLADFGIARFADNTATWGAPAATVGRSLRMAAATPPASTPSNMPRKWSRSGPVKSC